MSKKEQILKLVAEYIQEKKQKKWNKDTDWIQYSGTVFDENEYVSAISSFLDEWMALGEKSSIFENLFPPHLGKKFGVFVNSGSSANLLVVAAAKSKNLYALPPKSKIITAVSCFPTTLNPILQLGFEPVFVDVEIPSLNMNLDLVEDALKKDPSIKAIMFAHALGNPPDMERLMHLVSKYGLLFFEDACDALGSSFDGKKLGSFGHMSTCSFYAAHHMSTGEGGFVATDDPRARKVLLSLRDWGRGCCCGSLKNGGSVSSTICKNRFKNWLSVLPDVMVDHKYIFEEIGFNLKPLELQAAIGIEQLKKIDAMHQARKDNFKSLFEIFKKYEDYFVLPEATKKSDPSWFAFPLTLKDGVSFCKNDFVTFLEKNRIQTRSYFSGNILAHSGYSEIRKKHKDILKEFPVSKKIILDTFFIGTYMGITQEKLDYIKDVVDAFFAEGSKK